MPLSCGEPATRSGTELNVGTTSAPLVACAPKPMAKAGLQRLLGVTSYITRDAYSRQGDRQHQRAALGLWVSKLNLPVAHRTNSTNRQAPRRKTFHATPSCCSMSNSESSLCNPLALNSANSDSRSLT